MGYFYGIMDLPFGNQTWLAGQSPTKNGGFVRWENHGTTIAGWWIFQPVVFL